MKVAKPHSDQKIEAIADYLSNGLEHDSEAEGIHYLISEFGLPHHGAQAIIKEYTKHYGHKPYVLNDELFPFIEKFMPDAKFGKIIKAMEILVKIASDKVKVIDKAKGGGYVVQVVGGKYDGAELILEQAVANKPVHTGQHLTVDLARDHGDILVVKKVH